MTAPENAHQTTLNDGKYQLPISLMTGFIHNISIDEYKQQINYHLVPHTHKNNGRDIFTCEQATQWNEQSKILTK